MAELRQLARWARHHRLTGKLPGRASNKSRDPYLSRDVEQIAAMVIPLGFSREDRLGTGRVLVRPVNWYTCRNLSADGNCTAYATRPLMCSQYPYGTRCEHGPACSWDAARSASGPWPPNHVPLDRLEAKAP